MIFIFNIVGVVMLIVSGAFTYGLSMLISIDDSHPGPFILMGVSCIFFDVTYRVQQPEGHWIRPSGGGHLFFIPVWLFGVIWLVIGIFHTITSRTPFGLLALGVIGFIAITALGLTAFQLAQCNRPDFSKFVAAVKYGDNDDSAPPERKTARDFRCSECGLPFDNADAKKGKCPWCGMSI